MATAVPPVHTTQVVFPNAAAASAADHQSPAQGPRAVAPKRRERRRRADKDSETGSSGSESSVSEDDSWTQWEGLRFTLAHGLGPGVRLCSDYFEVAGQLWRVEVYPAGVSAEAVHHLSLFLTTPGSSVTSNQVLHKIVIVDQSGKGHHISKTKSRVHGPLLASRGIVAAYPKAVKLSHLMGHAKHYLLHDTLLVRATVQIVRSWSYDVPPAVMYPPEQYQDVHQPGMTASRFQGHDAPNMPDMQW